MPSRSRLVGRVVSRPLEYRLCACVEPRGPFYWTVRWDTDEEAYAFCNRCEGRVTVSTFRESRAREGEERAAAWERHGRDWRFLERVGYVVLGLLGLLMLGMVVVAVLR